MKSILMSIQPKWCELIASGKKTIEVRKTRPKLNMPFKVYIYCCKPKQILRYVWNKADYEGYPFADQMDDNEKVFCKIPDGSSPFCSSRYAGKVIGEFVCDKYVWVVSHPNLFAGHELLHEHAIKRACLTTEEAEKYANGKNVYGYHISNLKIYDKPKELSEFYRKCEKMWCEGCEHLKYQRVNSNEYDYECEYLNYLIPITRPPQSYCYVEELNYE